MYNIYKISSTLGNKCYIGQTKKTLKERLAYHVKDYKLFKKQRETYTSSYDIFELYGIENCTIELIEQVDNIEREKYYINQYEHSVNKMNKRCVKI